MPELIFILGVTASGKTEYALKLAEQREAVILSCDSLCVYRGMDIGTAKPTLEEQKRAPHYGLDIAEPWERFSVADYIRYRDRILHELIELRRTVIVCGGSGFYLKSFFVPVIDTVNVPDSIDAEVRSLFETQGLDGLNRALRAEHSKAETFAGLDWKNPRRVMRALARTRAAGKSYTELKAAFESQEAPLGNWRKSVFLLNRSVETLSLRNRLRVEKMLEAGWIEEVKALRRSGFERNPMASGSIGYAEILQFLDGKIADTELPDIIITRTNQLMRKQRNWFRHHFPEGQSIELK
jgi:tRNA dimethylallyltransferase